MDTYEKVTDDTFKKTSTEPTEQKYSVLALKETIGALQTQIDKFNTLLLEAEKVGCKIK